MKRVDSTSYLYHWVKSEPHHKIQHIDHENAYTTFMKILHDAYIKHGDVYKTNGERCICFTESPEYFMHRDKSKYQPFGFKFYKKQIFALGGRAVIYAPDYERDLLPQSIIWRYMRHDPFAISDRSPYGVDFTWEREWRLPEPELYVQEALSIIVPDKEYIERVNIDTEVWLNSNANYMHAYNGHYAPHPDFEDYIDTIRRMLIIPEEFD
ncbi:hypothetical protein ACLBW2_01735 [Enterobacteriaceae bacterium C23F]